MIVNNYDDIAYELEGFITEFETSTLLNVAKKSNDWSPNREDFWTNRIAEIYENPEAKEILDNIHARVENLFSSFSGINRFEAISRFFAGDSMPAHYDEVGHPEIAFGIIIYLNDEYSGGEIFYPDNNIKIKPKAGSLVMHSGSIFHQVTEVAGSTRYFMTTFVHGNNSSPAKLRSFEDL